MGCEIAIVTVPIWIFSTLKPGESVHLLTVPPGATVDRLPSQEGDFTNDQITLRFSIDDPSVPDPTITVSFGSDDTVSASMVFSGTSDQWGK